MHSPHDLRRSPPVKADARGQPCEVAQPTVYSFKLGGLMAF